MNQKIAEVDAKNKKNKFVGLRLPEGEGTTGGNRYYQKNQNFFFNAPDRQMHFLARNEKNSDKMRTPPCNLYKPRHSLVEKKDRMTNFNLYHPQMNFIE